MSAQASTAHHLRVTLNDVQPPVTREIWVYSDASLEHLHDVLQRVMAWEDAHLYLFRRDGRPTVLFEPRPPPEYEDDFDLIEGSLDTATHCVAQLLPSKGARATYEYDFGDGWEHALEVLAIGAPPPRRKLPAIVAATGSAPPEDCGGPAGFSHFRHVMEQVQHPGHMDAVHWFGGIWDDRCPTLDTLNRRLRELR